jgi:sialidase-1
VTWGSLQVVSTDGEHTVGNPSPVVDPRSGDVVLLSVRTAGTATEALILRGDVAPEDSRRVWLQRGVDHGARWTRPTDITEQVKRPGWRWYATGPGHAIALRHGAHTGRLVVPANHSVPGDARTGRYGGHLLLSDDGGRSFCIGAEAAPGAGGVHANETAVAELSDGRIYLNTRDQGARPGTPTRAHTWSSSAGETLDVPYTSVRDLHGPVVQNSVLAVAGRLLVAGPSAPGARQRLAVRTSADAGRSFPQEQVVWAGPAAYSDLVDLGDGVVGVAFEHGRDGPYERIGFTRLRLA